MTYLSSVIRPSVMILGNILYNFDRFVGHASQGVPDVPKYGRCHGVTKGPDERSENVTNLIVAILA